jgi:hypothetical protein
MSQRYVCSGEMQLRADGGWMMIEDHLREIAAKDAEIARLREQLAAIKKACTEVNDRYIGGSPVKGRLGTAIEQLAATVGKNSE